MHVQDQNCVFSVSVEGPESDNFTAEPSSARSFALVQLRVRGGARLDYEETQSINFSVSLRVKAYRHRYCLDSAYRGVLALVQIHLLVADLCFFCLFHSHPDDGFMAIMFFSYFKHSKVAVDPLKPNNIKHRLLPSKLQTCPSL